LLFVVLKFQSESFEFIYWVVPGKIHTPPTEEIFAVRRGRGDKIVSDNIVNVLGHPKGVGGLTSNFLCSVGVVCMFSGMTHYLCHDKYIK
jgi:hypothetical protein